MVSLMIMAGGIILFVATIIILITAGNSKNSKGLNPNISNNQLNSTTICTHCGVQ